MYVTILLLSVCALLIAVCVGQFVYKRYSTRRRQDEIHELFLNRQNCAILYNGWAIIGWPPENVTIIDSKNPVNMVDPLLFFIRTATYSLKVSMLSIHIKEVFDALCKAAKEGLKVDVIVDLRHAEKELHEYRILMASGVNVLFNVANDVVRSGMHSDYIVKDFYRDTGFVYLSSFNLVDGLPAIRNFGNILFSTRKDIVTSWHKKFERAYTLVLIYDNGNPFSRKLLYLAFGWISRKIDAVL